MHKQPESNENENKSIYQNSCDNFYPTYTQTNPEQTPIQQNEESIKVIANIIKEPNLKKTKARKNATCPVCYQKFECYEDYQVHVQKHNGDIEKPYKCKACGKSYLCASLLNRHLFTHTNTKLYECSVCKKGFNNSAHLKSHMYVHTGEKPFSCNVCDKGFNQMPHLKRHMASHHNI